METTKNSGINPQILKWARKRWALEEWPRALTKFREITTDLTELRKIGQVKNNTLKKLETKRDKLGKRLLKNYDPNKIRKNFTIPKYDDWDRFSETEKKFYKNLEEFGISEAIKKTDSNKYEKWESGEAQPTWTQIKKITKNFHISVNVLYSRKIPKYYKDKQSIANFRTFGNHEIKEPSSELLDVIRDAQYKQEWYREYKIREEHEKFIGFDYSRAGDISDIDLEDNNTLNAIADDIRCFLELDESSKDYKINDLIKRVTSKGVMVMRTNCVGENNYRSLNPKEFTGFALYDEYAPLIFINGKTYPTSQFFTLAHELAHLYLKESGLDRVLEDNSTERSYSEHHRREQQCNKIAARVLLPDEIIEKDWKNSNGDEVEIAKNYGNSISVFVILLRALDREILARDEFSERWNRRRKEIDNSQKQNDERLLNKYQDGKFYSSIHRHTYRLGGEIFINAVIEETLNHKILYNETYSLLGLKSATLRKYASKVLKYENIEALWQ